MFVKQIVTDKINKIFNLPATGDEQDWEIELADSGRLNEFINYLESEFLSSDEKYALMSLIFASYDKFLEEGEDAEGKHWTRIQILLNRHVGLYSDLLSYWGLKGNGDDDVFKITPFVRGFIASLRQLVLTGTEMDQKLTELTAIKVDGENWRVYYQDNKTGEKWVKEFLHSEHHGGGEPQLKLIDGFPWEQNL